MKVDETRHDRPTCEVVFGGVGCVDTRLGDRRYGAIFHEYIDLAGRFRTRSVDQGAVSEDDRRCRVASHISRTLL